MTQPVRHTADTITSDALDQLYADLEKAKRAADLLADSHRRAEQAEAAIREAGPVLRSALDCLDATCRYHGDRLDPDEYGRRFRAEACCDTGVEPRRAREGRAALDRLCAALDEPQGSD